MKKRNCTILTRGLLAVSAHQSLAQSNYEPYTFTTLAGYSGNRFADGTGSATRFWRSNGVAVDSGGNVYVADTANNTIRKGFPARSVPSPILEAPSRGSGQFGFGLSG